MDIPLMGRRGKRRDSMGYRLLADFVMLLHGAFVLFAVLGGILVLRRLRWAWLHLPAFLWAGFIELTGGVCPLTPLENRLRTLAGEGVYRGAFIDHTVAPLLYPDGLTREHQIILGSFVLIVNAVIYAALRHRTRIRRKSG
jgi:hypothetical protein